MLHTIGLQMLQIIYAAAHACVHAGGRETRSKMTWVMPSHQVAPFSVIGFDEGNKDMTTA